MVGYAHNNTKIKEEQQSVDSTELKKLNDPLDQSYIELEDLPDSFFDSLLDFDGWVEDNPNSAMADVMNSETKPNLENLEKCLEIKKEEEEEEVFESAKLGDLGCLIEEGLGRVRLTSGDGSAEVVAGDENGQKDDGKPDERKVEVSSDEVNKVKNDTEKGVDSGESQDSEEESSSSSSSSSSSDDDDEEEDDDDDDDSYDEEEDVKGKKEVKREVEMEEGEIRDTEVEEMIGWSDDEYGNVVKGPIRSKNEVQDLPPVPPVNVTIEPHHQTLPVGVILSMIGAQVIVEGVEKHNPLSEGSILWITESRSPLGVIDEIFGPVKNPYYIVRYNSETEVPTGIQQGSLISFVPEFADYVLNNNNIYKKGYDASGENDEELNDEIEFSDDEKEAEYKKMLKMSKRGSNEQKTGQKNDKKSRNRKNIHQLSSFSNGPTGGSAPIPSPSPASSPGTQAPNFNGPNGFGSMGFPPNGFPPNGFGSMAFQNPSLPNLSPFHPGPIFPSNFIQGVPPNFGPGPGFGSWSMGMPQNGFSGPTCMPQNGFSGPMGMPQNGFSGPMGMPQNGFSGPLMGFQGLFPNPSMSIFPQGPMTSNGLQMNNPGGMMLPVSENAVGMMPPMSENKGGARPPFVGGNGQTSQNVGQRNRFLNRGGRKPFQRGGDSGSFRGGRGGGRGRQQSR